MTEPALSENQHNSTNQSTNEKSLRRGKKAWQVLGVFRATEPFREGGYCAVRVSVTSNGPVDISYQFGLYYPANEYFRLVPGILHKQIGTFLHLFNDAVVAVKRGLEGGTPPQQSVRRRRPSRPLTATLGEQIAAKEAV